MLLRLFELAPGHVLAIAGESSATFGDVELFAQLTSAGGPLALRGYGADELLLTHPQERAVRVLRAAP